jgi:type IV secretory pathway TrbF-like protein
VSESYGLTPPAVLYPTGTETLNPYEMAQAELRDEIERERRQRRNAQRATGALSLVVLGLGAVIVYLVLFNLKVFTYVVEVSEPGQVRSVGILPQTWHGQTPAVIEQCLRQWLYGMRRLGLDPVMQTELWTQANAYMSSAAVAMAKPFILERLELQKKEFTTQVEITSLLPLTQDFHAVEIEWRERTFTRQGTLQSDLKYKSIINIAIYQPGEIKDPKTMRNPLGIFVTDYAVTEIGKGMP